MSAVCVIRSVISWRRLLSIAVALLALVVLAVALHRRLLCAGLFLRLEQKSEPNFVVHYGEHAVHTRPFAYEGGRGMLYLPEGVEDARGLVLAHGIHEQGITEPRLVRFARALAGAGMVVLTPEVPNLARYRIVHEDVVGIARAARALARELGRAQVSVFGISFGGGLALRAACEPELRGAIDRVIALGAHHDAARVSRFFLGEPAHGPAGEVADVKPHQYGRTAIWMSLFGAPHNAAFNAQERARALSAIAAATPELDRASPSHCPTAIDVPIFLVHGTGDRVVPYTETLWNQRQLGAQTEVRVLVSPAIVHAEYDPPSWWERVQLVEFIVRALF